MLESPFHAFFFLLFMFYHQNTPFFLLVAFVFSGPFGSTKLLLSFFSFDYLLVLVDKAKNGEFHHFLFLNLSCLCFSFLTYLFSSYFFLTKQFFFLYTTNQFNIIYYCKLYPLEKYRKWHFERRGQQYFNISISIL